MTEKVSKIYGCITCINLARQKKEDTYPLYERDEVVFVGHEIYCIKHHREMAA